jgi:RecA/RadA recombinase
MPVRWTLASPAVMDHRILVGTAEAAFGASTDIPAITNRFRALSRQRLVITGGPGSGKTTLAVQLVLELAADHGSVPALFSVVGWDPAVHPAVADWLAEQLYQDYPGLRAFGNDTAEALVASGRVLPVLDGLDETQPERRSAILTALNRTLPAFSGLILTCRTEEFADTVASTDVLTAAAVVEAQPLDVADAITHLRLHLPPVPGEGWSTVLERLSGTPAAAVIVKPLGLWLVKTVYVDARQEPSDLLTADSASTLMSSLFEQLIPALLRSRPVSRSRADLFRPRRTYDPARLRHWLTTIASELHLADTRDWTWWRHANHTLTTGHIQLRALTLGAVVTAIVGSTLGLSAGLASGMVAVMLNGGLAGRLNQLDRPPVHVNLHFHGRRQETIEAARQGFITLALAGIVAIGFLKSWLYAPGLAVLYGVARFFDVWSRSESVAQRVSSPLLGYRGDRAYTGLNGVVLAITAAATYGTTYLSPLASILMGISLSAAAHLASLTSAWPSFAMSSAITAARGDVPWRLMTTLDDAHRLGLLRVVGQIYQFRHADLQDHLFESRHHSPQASA